MVPVYALLLFGGELHEFSVSGAEKQSCTITAKEQGCVRGATMLLVCHAMSEVTRQRVSDRSSCHT